MVELVVLFSAERSDNVLQRGGVFALLAVKENVVPVNADQCGIRIRTVGYSKNT